MFTIYQLLIIIKVLSTSNKLKQEAKENRDIRSIVFPIKIYHNFHMIMNPADAMMQRSVKSVHSSDLSRETRKRFFPKRIMSEQEARVACKTRRWQTAAPHTSTDLHSCLKSVEGIFTWKERKGDRDREKRTLMTASDVQIDIILALLAPRESFQPFFLFLLFCPSKANPRPLEIF